MGLDDWLLALHLLSAFALVAALTLFSVTTIVMRRATLPEQVVAAARLMPVGRVVVVVGSLGVVSFGVWLAISLDDVEVWNAWVIVALVLWAIGSEAGRQAETAFAPCAERANELIESGQTGPDGQLAELGRTQKGARASLDCNRRDAADPGRHDLEAWRLMLAVVRPDSLNLPLFVHVFGAMVLVGGLLVTSTAALVGRGDARVLRLGARALLLVSLPGFLLMRVGAQWIYAREHLDDLPDDPAWIAIGYVTADAGGLLLVISLVLGGFGLRRIRQGGGTGLLRASLLISVLLLAAYIVTVWAMGAKPV